MGAVQGPRQAIVFTALAGATYAVARREQTLQVHRRRLREAIFHSGTITFLRDHIIFSSSRLGAHRQNESTITLSISAATEWVIVYLVLTVCYCLC